LHAIVGLNMPQGKRRIGVIGFGSLGSIFFKIYLLLLNNVLRFCTVLCNPVCFKVLYVFSYLCTTAMALSLCV